MTKLEWVGVVFWGVCFVSFWLLMLVMMGYSLISSLLVL